MTKFSGIRREITKARITAWDEKAKKDFPKLCKKAEKLLTNPSIHPKAVGIIVELVFLLSEKHPTELELVVSALNLDPPQYRTAVVLMKSSSWVKIMPTRAADIATRLQAVADIRQS